MSNQIQTTLGALVNAEPALAYLAGIRMSATVAHHIRTILRIVRVETADFTTQRNALIQELGEERDATPEEAQATGQTRLHAVLPANYQAFSDRLQELASVPVDLPVRPLTLEDLGSVELSARDLDLLGPFVVDPSYVQQ